VCACMYVCVYRVKELRASRMTVFKTIKMTKICAGIGSYRPMIGGYRLRFDVSR